MKKGEIYTETVVRVGPAAFEMDVPYQVVIVTLEDGSRLTARMAATGEGSVSEGNWVKIGAHVVEVDVGTTAGFARFRRA